MANPRSFYDTLTPAQKRYMGPIFERLEALEAAQAASLGKVTQPLDTHLDAGGNQLQNVAAPTLGTDVVNLDTLKKYVDAAIRQRVP